VEADFSADFPIFIQIGDMIESEISVRYKINPATALKGITRLADEGVLYKKRGLGMFVAEGAREKIIEKRQRQFYEKFMQPLMREAKKLELSYEQLAEMIRRGYTP
jgi:DNA-binding transcriptional regulator YhcF (GntR family)